MKATAVSILFLVALVAASQARAQLAEVYISNTVTQLRDSCTEGTPLPDGTIVSIYWDINGNGADSVDQLLEVGDCLFCVNFNTFEINGDALFDLPGTFRVDSILYVNTSLIRPWYIYLQAFHCETQIKCFSAVYAVDPGPNDAFFVEWWDDTCDVLSAAPKPANALGQSISLHPNYPNPFNPSTEISFDLPHSMSAGLKVYDVLGREVAELVDGMLSAGAHTVMFDASTLSSGVYFYRLDADEFIETRKMVLMK